MAIPIGPVPISPDQSGHLPLPVPFGLEVGDGQLCGLYAHWYGGVPVFSGFTGGLGKLAGPTGGYIIGFVPMAVLAGLVIDHSRSRAVQFVGDGRGHGGVLCLRHGVVLPFYGQHSVRRPVAGAANPKRVLGGEIRAGRGRVNGLSRAA